MNLAAKVRDEDHWHIPKVGEVAEGTSAGPPGRSDTIDLNTADVALLTTLPGIGEVKANAIVRYREANGPFSSIEALLDVSGIGPATVEAIRDLVTLR